MKQLIRRLSQILSPRRRLLRFIHLDGYNQHGDRDALAVGRLASAPAIEVELDAEKSMREALLARTAETWRGLGETAADWSVLATKKPLSATEFSRSGRVNIQQIAAAFDRCGCDLAAVKSVLELGCGVGRITQHLANTFERVIAVDISTSHLAIAKQRVPAPNVEFRRIASVEEVVDLPVADLFFSVIVLQHNPPPVAKAMLDAALSRVRKGGFAYFQVPTYARGYSHVVADYLAQPPSGRIEMHVLPQPVVYSLLAARGFDVLEVQEDGTTGNPSMLSQTFFARRPLAVARPIPIPSMRAKLGPVYAARQGLRR